MARELWWAMLWFMRRPWMKRLQRASTRIFGEARQAKAVASLQRQNAFARRYGLPLITIALNLMLASILVTTAYLILLNLGESGALTVP